MGDAWEIHGRCKGDMMRYRGDTGEIRGRCRLAEDVAAARDRHRAAERLGAHRAKQRVAPLHVLGARLVRMRVSLG